MKTIKNKFYSVLLLLFLVSILPLEAACKNIKIGLATEKKINIGANSKAVLHEVTLNKPILKINKIDKVELENKNGKIEIKHNGLSLGLFDGPIKLLNENKDGTVFCNNNSFRGELIIITSKDGNNVSVINNVDLEDYLLSVVPSEMPYRWHIEALKAQTIAARSYAIGYLGRRKEKGYDLESSVEDQVYKGIITERDSTTKAVKETKGEILVDGEGKPLITLFHSSAGGYTDSIENIWRHKKDIKPSPHIQPRPDYDDNSPHFKWQRTYSILKLNELLSGLNIGEIANVIPLNKSISGRIMKILIIGTNKEKEISGEEFRMLLKLPSSRFNLAFDKGNVNFAGRGYGHGLGLSQWGAKALAEKGFTYKEILAHYYTGAKFIKLF